MREAVYRYEVLWMPLLKENKFKGLVPPLDVAYACESLTSAWTLCQTAGWMPRSHAAAVLHQGTHVPRHPLLSILQTQCLVDHAHLSLACHAINTATPQGYATA